MNAQARGQTLVVTSLTVLLVALMVLTTLAINMKLREKIELQHVADASAYTNAIITARVYNSIALINRTEVSHMVALSGIESLISWSSEYRATLNVAPGAWAQISKEYRDQGDACGIAAADDIDNNVLPGLATEKTRVVNAFDPLDTAAGKQAFNLIAYMVGQLYTEQKNLNLRLHNELQAQTFIKDIVKIADKGSRTIGELSAPDAADSTSLREIDDQGNGASLERQASSAHAIYATMGTRGAAFLTNRGGGDGPMISRLQQVYGTGKANTSFAMEGSGYFYGSQNHSAAANGVYAWADDHATATFVYTADAPCGQKSRSENPTAFVRSTDANDFTDWHEWTGETDDQPPTVTHDLPKCVPDKYGNGCPGMWPMFVDYNNSKVADKDDIYGQPKNFAVIQRDYNARTGFDPWAFNFNFKFEYGEDWDNRALQTKTFAVDLSKQTALAAGLAYYHRYGHWREPPNFLNPFWRATLVSAEVDKQGELDVPAELMNAGVPYAADAYTSLRNVGFAGTQ